MHDLADDGPGGADGFSKRPQRPDATFMVPVVSMEHCDQGTSINQYHDRPRPFSSLVNFSPVRSDKSGGPPLAQPMRCEKAS
jgi:hypothetical protein